MTILCIQSNPVLLKAEEHAIPTRKNHLKDD